MKRVVTKLRLKTRWLEDGRFPHRVGVTGQRQLTLLSHEIGQGQVAKLVSRLAQRAQQLRLEFGLGSFAAPVAHDDGHLALLVGAHVFSLVSRTDR